MEIPVISFLKMIDEYGFKNKKTEFKDSFGRTWIFRLDKYDLVKIKIIENNKERDALASEVLFTKLYK